jgi:hypothetical protein
VLSAIFDFCYKKSNHKSTGKLFGFGGALLDEIG